MIGLKDGLALRDTGLRWEPADGDHFVIPDRGMDERVFVISHMLWWMSRSPRLTPAPSSAYVEQWAELGRISRR